MMLKRLLLIGFWAAALVSPAFRDDAHAQSGLLAGLPSPSLDDVKQAILVATGYDPTDVELTTTNLQFLVTLVNSKLGTGPAARARD
jgi:hypothetical protein